MEIQGFSFPSIFGIPKEKYLKKTSWVTEVLMLEGINRSMVSFQRLQGIGMAPLMAYRRWADSFGLDAPSLFG